MYDIIVVGAGPAGSSAARHCAQRGLSTLLIDKAVFPRDKLCGGAVSNYASSQLDFALPAELIEREIYGARLYFGASFTEVKKPRRLAVTVSRLQFDHFLLKKAREAGAEILEDRMVSGLIQDRNGVEVIAGPDKFSSRAIIGCDGFNSFVARYVRRRHTKSEYGNCVEVNVPAEESVIDRYLQGTIHVHLGIVQGGYGWIFPHKGYFAVGLGGVARYLPAPKRLLHDFLASTGFATDLRMRGFPVPAGGVPRKTTADRIVLAGDAAGFVDPFTGEGIAFAIRSGQLAAETVVQAIQQGNVTRQGLSPYVARCEREFGESLRYSLLLARLMHRFPAFFLKLMASQPEAIERYVADAAREQSYRTYLAWLLPRVPRLWMNMMTQRKRPV
jgi:geranylgeranyl reductase family protein